jgi:hypothetical protein
MLSAVGAASAPTHSTGVGNPPRFDEDVQLPLIKVVVLGAQGVGKTALVKVRIFSVVLRICSVVLRIFGVVLRIFTEDPLNYTEEALV